MERSIRDTEEEDMKEAGEDEEVELAEGVELVEVEGGKIITGMAEVAEAEGEVEGEGVNKIERFENYKINRLFIDLIR